ncbi:MAG: GspH/FimT family pseudopilin [Hyphomicrobium sp.]|nr:GspH/FimT family pseudopilin [Hyphomicrobium sp.]
MTKRAHSGETDAGFSILELFVVLVIAALALSFTVPRLSGTRQALSVEAASAGISAAFRTARAEAMASGRFAAVTLVPKSGRYWIGSGNATSRALPQGVRMTVSGGLRGQNGARVVRFSPRGTAEPVRVRLAGGGRRTEIALDWLTGRPVTSRARGRR